MPPAAQLPAPKPSVRSVPWRLRDALVVFLLPWVVLPILMIIILAILVPFVPALRPFVNGLLNGDVQASFALVILDAIGSYATIAFYLQKYHVSWRELGFRRFSLLRATILIIGIFVLFALSIGIIYALIQTLYPSFNAEQPQTNEFTNAPTSAHWYSLLALVIIPPLVEEPVFRGFIFPAFSRRFGVLAGAIISSVLFGFAHLQANVGVYTFVLGLLLCFLYARLGSIIPGMALHMLNNYIAYTAINQIK